MPVDTEVFEYVSCSVDDSVIQDSFEPEFDSTDNTFKCNVFSTNEGDAPDNVTDDGTLVAVTLRVKDGVAVGNYTLDIQLDSDNIINADDELVEFVDVDCVVMVRNAR